MIAAALLALLLHQKVDAPCARPTVKAIIWCAVDYYGGVPNGVDYAVYIGERESGLDPTQTNAGGCAGVYQFCPSTWAHLIEEWPLMNDWYGTDANNARGNIMRAIRTAHETGWDPWRM